MELKDKKAIVTGGGKGLGKSVALALAASGVHIGITGRNEANLQTTVAELKALGVQAFYTVFSVDDATATAKGIDNLVQQLGGLDILINNAGIASFGSVEEMAIGEWEQQIKTNLFGVYYAAKAVIPVLKANGQGDIVNVASTAGLKGAANMSAYAASKAAVIALSQSLMAELRKSNIRVFTLTPSTIATDISIDNGLTDGNAEKVLQPEDFAEWVVDMLKMKRRALIANGSLFSTNP